VTVRDGDDIERRSRLERLFADHAPAVLAYARRRADPATADDVLSEVFVVAWRRLDEMPGDALPWLLGCARRVLANQRRGEHRRSALAERMAHAHSLGFVPELDDGALADALASLTERDREVLRLVAWEDVSPERAAAVLGCSTRAFTMRLHRARKRLATALGTPTATAAQTTTEAFND
jgi:RNA polymerase sigma-70 factor (ECF subfamily)